MDWKLGRLMRFTPILVLLLSAPPTNARDVFKCIALNGSVTYADKPCAKSGTIIEIDEAPATQPYAPRPRGPITIGMTAVDVRKAWGEPGKVNRSVYSFGVHEQWVYGRANTSEYVYIRNGKVTSWSD